MKEEFSQRPGRKGLIYATLNKHKRLQHHFVPLRVFDEENVLFSLSTQGLNDIIVQAEQEERMLAYESGR